MASSLYNSNPDLFLQSIILPAKWPSYTLIAPVLFTLHTEARIIFYKYNNNYVQIVPLQLFSGFLLSLGLSPKSSVWPSRVLSPISITASHFTNHSGPYPSPWQAEPIPTQRLWNWSFHSYVHSLLLLPYNSLFIKAQIKCHSLKKIFIILEHTGPFVTHFHHSQAFC
jgi:hypothetical protein